MPVLRNDTLLRALRREPTPRTPIWLMRQAGRYLPEYNTTRSRAGSFMALATTPSLAAEVTLQPLARYPLDAAILFSDILTIPDAMGLGLTFESGEGPRFASPVRDETSVAKLEVPDMARLRYVFDAVTSIRRALNGRVQFVGVVFQDDESKIQDFLNQRGSAYPTLIDEGGKTAIAYGVGGVPETFFLDKSGKIVAKFTGPMSTENLQENLQKAMQ